MYVHGDSRLISILQPKPYVVSACDAKQSLIVVIVGKLEGLGQSRLLELFSSLIWAMENERDSLAASLRIATLKV
jgi:hypothetical protein